MPRLTWYFDFISPFSYLQLCRFGELPKGTDIQHTPVLFAGLLGHWGQKGPAEIAPKRERRLGGEWEIQLNTRNNCQVKLLKEFSVLSDFVAESRS